jgi:Group II intron, maturase-specific domain
MMNEEKERKTMQAGSELSERVRVRHAWSRYVQGWFGYYRISHTWGEVLELDQWMRRRVRQCYWKQWKRGPTRRRMLLRLGAAREEVHLASRSRKGCWRMSTNSLVQGALTNEWLDKQGVPNRFRLIVCFPSGRRSKVSVQLRRGDAGAGIG